MPEYPAYGSVVDLNAVHRSGNEAVAGVKSFQSAPTVPDASFAEVKVALLLNHLAESADPVQRLYCDVINGNDTNVGRKPGAAFQTLEGLLAAVGPGAPVSVTLLTPGNYDLVMGTVNPTNGLWINGLGCRDPGTATSVRRRFDGAMFDWQCGGGMRDCLIYDPDPGSGRLGAALRASTVFAAGAYQYGAGDLFFERCRISSVDAGGAWERIIDLDGTAGWLNPPTNSIPPLRRVWFIACELFGGRLAGDTIRLNRVAHVWFLGGHHDPAPTAIRQGINILDAASTDVYFDSFEGLCDLVHAGQLSEFDGRFGSGPTATAVTFTATSANNNAQNAKLVGTWLDQSGNGNDMPRAGRFHGQPIISGLYHPVARGPIINKALVNGNADLGRFQVDRQSTFTRIGCNVTVVGAGTGGAGTKVIRLMVYRDNGMGKPGALVLDVGATGTNSTVLNNGFIDATTLGYQEVTINLTLPPGTYWIGPAPQGCDTTAPQISGTSGDGDGAAVQGSGSFMCTLNIAAMRGVVNAACPATFPAVSNAQQGPRIVLLAA